MKKLICNSRKGGGKTSSFARVVALALVGAAGAMTALGELPAGYTQVPFIKANGNCHVKTGVNPTSTDKVEMSFRPMVVNATQNLWCSRDGSGTSHQFTAFLLNSAKVRIDRNEAAAGQKTSSATLLACTNYTVVADYAAGTCVVTNEAANTQALSVAMADTADFVPGSELCLFASHSADPDTGLGNYGSYCLNSFKLRDASGNLKLDLVPAKRDADGVLGLYDLARSTFLTNCQSGVFTTANMTITPSDPLWGKALTIADDITIEAGEGAAWQGTIYVYDGGSLTTRGNLNVAGSTVFYPGSSVTIDTGTAYFTFSAGYIRGNLTVNAGATLRMNVTEAFKDQTTAVFHLYGTLDVQATRQRIDCGKYFFHDGSRVIGAGDAYGALYAYRNSRIVFDGTVEIEPPVAMVNAYTLTAACCENARVAFKGGFKANTTSQKNGVFVQEAATAEEGNASGTCANAFVEVGPCAYGGAYYYTGSMNFVSPAKIVLANTNGFTVATSVAQLELVADKATGLSNHAAVLPLPEIVADATSASLPTVRLTGDGTVSLPTAAPAYPIEFAGPSLAIANGAPIALAAGSSVTAPMTVGVNDLPAGTAATLFTNAGSIDASKISAKPAHNGVLMGTAAAATLSGTDVVTAGVAAYDATAWIEPYIAANALIWLDASDAANFEFKDNTFGFVTTWKDKSSYKRDATAYTIDSHEPNWGMLSVTNGVPAYCMGACDSGIDLAFSVRMTTIRTVFWAMSICQDSRAFFLGDSSTYRFHRGGNGQYCYNNSSALWKNGKIYCDGVLVADNLNTLVPTDRHVYSTVTAANCESNRLTLDRTSGSSIRHGGRELSELIAFDVPLSDADREAIETYLAAKWMGSNPTAARSDDTFIYKSDFIVDGYVGGGKNLVFKEGASVSVSNPSSSEPMVSTTGAVTLPSGSPLAVNVDATALVPGTYTVMQAGSGITSLSQFAPTATVGAGATATFAVVDGKLTMTISVTASVSSQTWRPESSADLVWNTTSPNWLYDGGATGGFIPYVPAFIDGAETATGDLTVSGSMFAGPITLTGANDYTFKGDGTLAGGDTVTLGGTGTVTLDGASFGDQTIVITNGQKVVLGPNASEHSLGSDSGSSGGKVEIAEGSQLNINYTGVTSGSADPRAEITQLKTFSIAGDGPDGRGALVNDALDGRTTHTYYNAQFRRIELADDATIGGTDRVDIRARTGTAATAAPGLYGPGKTLTVKNEQYFCILSQPIDVGAIVVPAGGMFLPATLTENAINIPGGITVDGGLVDFYNTVFPSTMPVFVTANGGTFKSEGGAVTIKGDVNVASGAALALIGDKNVTYSGAFNANGATITSSNSMTNYFKGASAGNLSMTQTAGTTHYQGTVAGDLAQTHSGGTAYVQGTVGGDISVSQSAGTIYAQGTVNGDVTVTKTGGDFWLGSGFSGGTVDVTSSTRYTGLYTENTAPVFDTFNIHTTGGEIYFQPQSTTTMIDVPGVINIGSIGQNIYVFGPVGNKGMKMKMVGTTTGKFAVGISSTRPATLHLKSGTDLTVQYFDVGGVGAAPGPGEVVIESGAKVKATSRVYVGCNSGAPTMLANHKLDIYGELDASTVSVIPQYDQPRGEVVLHEGGLMKAKQLYGAHTFYVYGSGAGITNAHSKFTMEGGRFELGATGFNSAYVIPGSLLFDLRNGTFANAAAWTTMPNTMPVFFGYDTVGGSVDYEMGSYSVPWNSGLSGTSDLTIKGSANFGGSRETGAIEQGVMLGKLTVQNTGSNDFRNVSALSGGLTLAPGVNGVVAKYSDEHYPLAVAGNYHRALATNEYSFAFVSGDHWAHFHAPNSYTYGHYGTTKSWATRFDFYVPAEKAGVWTFCGSYDDYLFMQIDGETVIDEAYTSKTAHQVSLSVGWHKVSVSTYNNKSGTGSFSSDGTWTGKTLGFIIGESASTAGGDYTKFEPGASLGGDLTLQVRPAVNACVWKWINAKPASSTWSTVDNWTHIKCIDSVAQMHLSGTAPAADTAGLYSGKINVFEGWFKVEDGKEGSWSFKLAYDDYHLLKIDGVQLLGRSSSTETKTGSTTLTAGWHRWEVRVSDGGSGGWGPNNINSGMTLSYKAPDESVYSRFDETNLKLAATLGDIAILEPSGIYKELSLGAGSTLTSSGTMAMPICGTLKGTGTLAGSFAFAGTTNCWEVTGASAKIAELPAATFANATAATFAGLKSVKVTFDAKPTRRAYYLTGAITGLTAADLPDATITVKDANDGDYSANFALTVKDGRLALGNSKPAGVTIIVR